MKAITLFLITLFLTINITSSAEDPKWLNDFKLETSKPKSPIEAWLVRPMDAESNEYSLQKLDPKITGDLLKSVNTGIYNENACDYYVLDIPFERSKEIGHGMMIFRNSERIIGAFFFKSKFINKMALSSISIKEFNPEKKIIKFDGNSRLEGVIIDYDFRKAFQKVPYK